MKWLVVILLAVMTPWVPADISPAAPASRPSSPIAYFRQLLAMSDEERAQALADRPEAQRKGLEAKVAEYQAMSPSDRELRLRATELRYFLLPLMRQPREQRDAGLKRVPEHLRELVESRLHQWDLVPPTLQAQLIENEAALELFSRMHPENPPNADELVGPLPTSRAGELTADLERWQKLSEGERRQVFASFNHFFQLSPDEKERTLRTLSPEERQAMEQTLRMFESLSPGQREACFRGFQQFFIMPPDERAKFLKNADRWKNMSPEDREQWRTVVRQLAQMPPLPPGMEPVVVDSPPLPPGAVPNMAARTN